uniref:Glycerol kinase n=1 Tax=Panagrolaimus sp. JU765 TaxID=591449 RepID=A0AC34RSZ2_9BILA
MTARILAVDIGTSSIRVCIFDAELRLLWSKSRPIILEYRLEGHSMLCEMDPEKLWDDFCLEEAGGSSNVLSCGICMQRNTFISWNKETLEPCHQLIVWNDCRGKDLCLDWNKSWTVKLLNAAGRAAHFLTHWERFKAAKMFRFLSAMVAPRFTVTLEKNPQMKKLLEEKKLALGCLDTWLLSKLTKGAMFAAEASCASSTGLFDPYLNDWGYTILKLIGFPVQVLPCLIDSTFQGQAVALCDSSIFGFPLQIGGMIGDQQSAVFGAGCRHKGSVKISLGTGTFVDLITGSKPHASMHGLYPLVAWRIENQPVYIAEGKSDDTGTLISWALKVGLCNSVTEMDPLARNAQPASGLFFVPAFGGIQTPINDDNACCAFIGLRADTTKAQMIRAILEAISFRVYQIWLALEEEIEYQIGTNVNVCGGVANNNFIVEMIATLIGKRVEKNTDCEFTAAKGAAMLGAISVGIMKPEESSKFVKIDRFIEPDWKSRPTILEKFNGWSKALNRCLNFYS